VKHFDWDESKNKRLRGERDICFEDVVIAINEDKLHDVIDHPNPKKYPRQRFYIVEIQNYIYIVPFVENETQIFLKTIYASRKFTRKYLKGV
jgi:uncharacterized DUF497 family protein